MHSASLADYWSVLVGLSSNGLNSERILGSLNSPTIGVRFRKDVIIAVIILTSSATGNKVSVIVVLNPLCNISASRE